MYIIIYIINYNEYIVMYNIESHSLTITSTTWLNNVPHWYTNCKCTDKKALDEVNEVAYAQRAINSLFFFLHFFKSPYIYILISWTTLGSLFDFSWAYIYIHIYMYICIYFEVYTSFRYTRSTYTQMRQICSARRNENMTVDDIDWISAWFNP